MKSSKSPKNKALPTAKKAERTGPFLMPKSPEAGRYTAVSRKSVDGLSQRTRKPTNTNKPQTPFGKFNSGGLTLWHFSTAQ